MQRTMMAFRSGSISGGASAAARSSTRRSAAPAPTQRAQQRQQHAARRMSVAAAAADGTQPQQQQPKRTEEELEAMMEEFMKQQAEKESGAAFARTREPEKVIGADVIGDEAAKAYCRAIVGFLRALKASRDMGPNEAKLVVMIESPEARERRKLGIEDERGVSRDEMAAALDDVAGGRIPKDRVALKCLYEEMLAWPDLAEEAAAQQRAAAEQQAAA